ncbi:MAG: hypothetical protein ACR2FH_08390 [Caulobacteraceae bacterium]
MSAIHGFDYLGRVTQISVNGRRGALSANKPTAVALAYDATGRLAGSTAASATTSFLYAGEALVGEYNGSAIANRYIPGPAADETLLMYAGAGTATPQWLAADPQGSTLAWSDAAGRDRLTDSPPSPSWVDASACERTGGEALRRQRTPPSPPSM